MSSTRAESKLSGFLIAATLAFSAAPAQSQTGPQMRTIEIGVETHATAMSADGETVVGYFAPFSGPTRAFRWNLSDGVEDLGLPFARATGVSADGSIVFGYVPGGQAFRWTRDTGTVLFEPFSPGQVYTTGGCSADGSFFTGTLVTNTLSGFRWGELGARDIISGGEVTVGGGYGGTAYAMMSYSGSSVLVNVNRPVTLPDRGLFGRLVPEIWTPTGQSPVWSGPPELQATATVISGDGQTVGGTVTETGVGGGNLPGSLWRVGGGGVDLGPSFLPSALSGDGSVVGSRNGSIYSEDLGTVSLDTYLDDIGLDREGGRIGQVSGLAMDGLRMAADVFYPGGRRAVVWIDLQQDIDGDGLYDDWEVNGIPYIDHTGAVRRYTLPGANPLRKDLYVELDSMVGTASMESAVNRVVAVFDQAPVLAPSEPGGLPGIALHVDLDDIGAIPSVTLDWPPFFAAKAQFFGTAAERARDDWTKLKEAKAKAYRYCISANRILGGFAGVGELNHEEPALGPRKGGNDLMIALTDYVPRPGMTLEDKQAVTFMHELGHTLGLYHGGGDAYQNLNPNHYSCMNYHWSGGRTYARPGQRILLDYSRTALPTLNEAALDESLGIQGNDPTLRIPILVRKPDRYGWCDDFSQATEPSRRGRCDAPHDLSACFRYVPFSGPVDWNNDGIIFGTTRTVCADPNHDLHTQQLVSVNEWNLLAYNFRDSVYYSDTAPLGNPPPCITMAMDAELEALPPPPPPLACPVTPPAVQTPVPAAAATCDSPFAEFTVDFEAADPFTLQWSWRDDSQDPPAWVPLANDGMPSGTFIRGADAEKLILENPNRYDFHSDTVWLRCRVTDACGQGIDSPECVLLIGGPVAAAASPLVVAACPGGSATFSVAASTATGPLSYRWDLFSESLNDGVLVFGTRVQGSRTNAVTLSNIDQRDFAGSKDGRAVLVCRVSDACGQAEGVRFDLYPNGVAVTSGPYGLDLGCEGEQPAVFTVSALGPPPLSFRWFRDGLPLLDGGRVSGAATDTLTITGAQGSDSGGYRCAVTSACATVESYEAMLNLGPPRLRIDPPVFSPTCLGATAILSIDVRGTQDYTIQWMKAGVDISDGYQGRFFGPQSTALLIADVQPDDLDLYSVRIHNSCGDLMSQPAALSLAQPILITEQPSSRLVCPGGAGMVSVRAAAQDGLTYRWRMEVPPFSGDWFELYDGSLVPCGSVSGAATPDLSVSLLGTASCASSIRVSCVVSIESCESVSSNPATVSLCPADVNCSGVLSVQDIFDFLAYYFAGDPRGDFNRSGVASVQDLFDFLAAYFAGCA